MIYIYIEREREKDLNSSESTNCRYRNNICKNFCHRRQNSQNITILIFSPLIPSKISIFGTNINIMYINIFVFVQPLESTS